MTACEVREDIIGSARRTIRRTTRGPQFRSVRVLVITVILTGLPVSVARAQPSQPLVAQTHIAPGPYYVGQAIDIQVSVIASSSRPTIVVPRLTGAEIWPTRNKLKPLMSSGIGNVINETIQYIYGYQFLARRSGSLSIPPFVARFETRTGPTRPRQIEIQEPPLAGQPATFLGGVGQASVETSVDPARVRVGQAFEYRIRLQGPGARGSVRRPDLDRVARRSSLRFSVVNLPDEVVVEPPSRVYRYRLRPTAAGQFLLPPVAVSTFEPSARRYLTQTSTSMRVSVVEVPVFDPSVLDSSASNRPELSTYRTWFFGGILTLGLAMLVVTLSLVRRLKDSRPPNLARLANRLSRGLENERNPEEIARRINAAFVSFLGAAQGRPPGVLTPVEAEIAFGRFAEDHDLGLRAAQIVHESDRVLFADDRNASHSLAGQAASFLRSLASRATTLRKNRERHI
jgi:hypothetical protein